MAFIAILVTLGAAFFGYTRARVFVKKKMQYVDAVQRPSAPWKAGLIAAAVAAPIAWILPAVTTASALVFGTAVGLGVAAGRRDLREHRYPA